MNRTLRNGSAMKQYFRQMSILLLAPLLMLPFQSALGDSVINLTPDSKADPVIMLTPGQSVLPTNLVISGLPAQLRLTASGEMLERPHHGLEIAIWNPDASPSLGAACDNAVDPFMVGPSGGIKWVLKAENSVVPDGDFETTVSYDLPNESDFIEFEFGNGVLVTVALSGAATVTPALPTGGFAWVDEGSNTPSTDNTLQLGQYLFASCGMEGDSLGSDFLGSTTFIVVEGCIQREQQPEDPISMNTVRNKSIVKTIHAEKQIFDCKLEQGSIPVIADVTIIAEIFENIDTKSIIKKQAMVVTCVKETESVQVLECNSEVISQSVAITRNCVEELIAHPQEMNTVNKGNIVKTIEAQKEVFRCTLRTEPLELKKVDIVLFTEIWENLGLLPDNPIIKTTFDYLRCVIDMTTSLPTVETCQFKTVKN